MFRGSLPAMVTPFDNGEVDVKGLKNLVNWHIEQGSHGLVPVGTTGESPTCLLYTSPSPRDYAASRMPSSA